MKTVTNFGAAEILKEEDPHALALKYGVQMQEEEIQIFTPAELARFEEIDKQREQNGQVSGYDIVLDCQLVFPDDDEEAEE